MMHQKPLTKKNIYILQYSNYQMILMRKVSHKHKLYTSKWKKRWPRNWVDRTKNKNYTQIAFQQSESFFSCISEMIVVYVNHTCNKICNTFAQNLNQFYFSFIWFNKIFTTHYYTQHTHCLLWKCMNTVIMTKPNK